MDQLSLLDGETVEADQAIAVARAPTWKDAMGFASVFVWYVVSNLPRDTNEW